MTDEQSNQVTRILGQIQAGDAEATEKLLPIVYQELRRMARSRMVNEPAGHTLQATALVHEVYLRLVEDPSLAWESRGHFFAAAAEAMRRILVERVRRVGRIKHGGGRRRVEFTDMPQAAEHVDEDLLAIHEALERLEALDARMSTVVKLRYFAGLSIDETASALGVTSRTVDRDWSAAKAWMLRELRRPS